MKAPKIPEAPPAALPPTQADARKLPSLLSTPAPTGIRTAPGGLVPAQTQGRSLLGGNS